MLGPMAKVANARDKVPPQSSHFGEETNNKQVSKYKQDRNCNKMATKKINAAVWDDDTGKDYGIWRVQKGDRMKQK